MDKNLLKEKIIEILQKKDENRLAEFLLSDRRKLFFGQGWQAWICYDICKRVDISVDAFMCSKACDRCSMLPERIPFYLPEELSNPEDYDVLLALNDMHNEAVIRLLKQYGFVHIYYSEDWKRTNKIYRGGYWNYISKKKWEMSFQ